MPLRGRRDAGRRVAPRLGPHARGRRLLRLPPFDIAALGACFAATGEEPPLGDLVLAYTIGQLGGLIPLPGGLGGTDGGLIGMFVLYGAPIGSVTAAVLLYRLLPTGGSALLRRPGLLPPPRKLRPP